MIKFSRIVSVVLISILLTQMLFLNVYSQESYKNNGGKYTFYKKYEAEKGAFNHAVICTNTNTSQGKYIGKIYFNDSYVLFNKINVDVAGKYDLTIAYKNGSGKNSKHKLSINNVNGQEIVYPPSGRTKNGFDSVKVKITLNAGQNKIKLSKGSVGYAELDYIIVQGTINRWLISVKDENEFGKDSITYRALRSLNAHWIQATSDEEKESIEFLAKEIRRISRESNGNIDSPLRLPSAGDLNEVERILYTGNIQEAKRWAVRGVEAKAQSLLYFNDGNFDSTNANAYKHAYWNALLTWDIGLESAKKWTDAHEYGKISNVSTTEKQMDLYNNNIGRQIGQMIKENDLSGVYCKEIVLLAVKKGKLKRLDKVVNGSQKRINGGKLVNTDNSSTRLKAKVDRNMDKWKQEIIDNIK